MDNPWLLAGCLGLALTACEVGDDLDSEGFRQLEAEPDGAEGHGAKPGLPPPAQVSVCSDQLSNAVTSGAVPWLTITPEGVGQFPPLAVSCEELLSPPPNAPPNTPSHGQAICSWKVAGVAGMALDSLEFIVWDNDAGETVCGCRCDTCNTPLQNQPVGYDAVGDGTQGSPYGIYADQQLFDLGASPQGWGSHFVQCNDIDLSSLYAAGEPEWIIGDNVTDFTGSYDGQTHTLRGFQLHDPISTGGYGLFGSTHGAAIFDLELEQVVLELDDDIDPAFPGPPVGALVGNAVDTEIDRVSLIGATIAGQREVGGLVGAALQSHIADVVVEADVQGRSAVGGVVGVLDQSTLTDIVSSSHVFEGTYGGLGSVPGNCGGVFGLADESTVSRAEAHGTVNPQGTTSVLGGLGGSLIDSSVTQSLATGAVQGGALAGGLLGLVDGDSTVEWCYATGDVVATSVASGGAAGFIGLARHEDWTDTLTIRNNYASGDATGPAFAVGFCSFSVTTPNASGAPLVSNSYASGDAVAQASGLPFADPDEAAPFAVMSFGVTADIEASFGYGFATSPSGPMGTFHFASFPSSASNFYNVDTGTFINPFAMGPTPASGAAGDFADPNQAPLSMTWPTGPGAWDVSGPLPTLPDAGSN